MSIINAIVVSRSLLYVGGGHDKFWRIQQFQDGHVETHYGRNGTNGQTTTKRFPDWASARDFLESKVDEKRRKGYKPAPDDNDLTSVPAFAKVYDPNYHAETAIAGLTELLKDMA